MSEVTLDEAIRNGDISLGRGNIISSKDIVATPGDYPIYSSSAKGVGEFGRYGHFMFDEELVTWSVDGGGRFFFRPKHKFSVTNVCGFMRVDKSKWDMQFVYYSLDFQHKQLSFDYQTKAHPSVIRLLYQLPKKPKPEQSKIAEVLSTVDRAIEKTEAMIAKQQRIKTGLMQDLLTRGIDEHGKLRSEETHEFKDSPLGRIPAEWTVCPLEGVTAKIADRDHTTPTYVDDGVLLISPMAFVGDEEIDFARCPRISRNAHDKNSKKTDCSVGDIILHRIGAGLGGVRVVCENHPEYSLLHSLALVRPAYQRIGSAYLKWSFRSFYAQIQMGLGTQSIGVPDLGLDKIASLQFKVPMSLDEQQRIGQTLDALQCNIEAIRSSMAKLRLLKVGLMQDLLTGDRRVTALLQERKALTA